MVKASSRNSGMGFAIVPLKPALQKTWDAIVQQSDDAWLFHSYDFLVNVVEKAWEYAPHHFLVKQRDTFVAICPFFVLDNKRRIGKSIFGISCFGPGGPAIINGLTPEQRKKIFYFIFNHIAKIAKQENLDYFRFSSPALSKYGANKPKPDVATLPFLSLKEQYTAIIPLRKPLHEIRAAFEKRCRNAITRAEREGITVVKAQRMEDIKAYYAMHRETYGRTGAVPHPFAYFKNIWTYFAPKGAANFFLAKKYGEPIAAINVAAFKQNSLYWTGCSKTAYRKTGVNNILQWHAIQWAKAQHHRYYEIGEAFPEAKSGKLKGLHDFKKSFGGELRERDTYRVIYKPFKVKISDAIKHAIQSV